MFQIVARTDAITVAHPSQVRGDIEAGRLAIIPYSLGKRGIAEIGFAYKRQRPPLPAAHAFMSLIRRHLKQAATA